MKSFFDSKPNSIESLGNGKFHVYWNIEAYVHEGDNERTEGWQADYLEVDKASYDNIVDKLIKRQYNTSRELAIHRQRDDKPAEWLEYFNYCEECKQIARQVLNINK